MEQNGDTNAFRWQYLIKPDKTATPQLEDLCIGLAKCIVDNEDGVGTELTPQRLAAFYRRVGGNYDTLFLKSGDSGLSFIYKTFGCFHSLQPTHTPFEIPNIPCLTPHGFARWQTLQLLLTPEESVHFLQKAVQIYRIPRQDGGFFPAPPPKTCFPAQPDQQMEDWYNNVTGHLNQDNYMRRLKHSPYQSPYPEDRKDEYFHNGSRSSSAEDQAKMDAVRRRSSVPEAISPIPVAVPFPMPGERRSHWDPNGRGPRKARSHSAQRPPQNTRQRSHTTSTPDRHGKPPSNTHHHHPRPNSQQVSQHRHRISDGRSPHSRNNSASDASSENSHVDQRTSRHRKSDREESPKRRRSSLWPPNFLKSHKRRHSSDAGYRKLEAPPTPKPPVPLRPEYYPRKPQMQQVPYTAAMPMHYPPPPQPRPYGGKVQFRNDMFNDPHHSGPDSPTQPHSGLDPRIPPGIRFPDNAGTPADRESSGSSGTDGRRHHSDWDRGSQRAAGLPTRVKTVSGVGGRQYPNAARPIDPTHLQGRVRESAPLPV